MGLKKFQDFEGSGIFFQCRCGNPAYRNYTQFENLVNALLFISTEYYLQTFDKLLKVPHI